MNVFPLPGPQLAPLTPNTSSASAGGEVSGGASGIGTGSINVVGVAQSGGGSGLDPSKALAVLLFLYWLMPKKKKG